MKHDNFSKGQRIYIEGKNVTIPKTVKFIEDADNVATNKQNHITE